MTTRPTYADYSALIDYLDERATRADVDPIEGARCYTWAEKLREDLIGLDPTSPFRPDDTWAGRGEDGDEGDDDGPFEDGDEAEDINLYTELRDLVSDALQIIEGTITDEKERASWLADAKTALGEEGASS